MKIIINKAMEIQMMIIILMKIIKKVEVYNNKIHLAIKQKMIKIKIIMIFKKIKKIKKSSIIMITRKTVIMIKMKKIHKIMKINNNQMNK